MDEETKRQYEFNYILSLQTSDGEISSFQKNFDGEVKASAGEIREVKQPIRQQLAYPIKKMTQGFVGEIIFDALPSVLQELEKKLRMEKNLLRYVIMAYSAPSPETKRATVFEQRIQKPMQKPAEALSEIKSDSVPIAPKQDEQEKKVQLDEIDKKLEEILGM